MKFGMIVVPIGGDFDRSGKRTDVSGKQIADIDRRHRTNDRIVALAAMRLCRGEATQLTAHPAATSNRGR
jgi:hypothetical protein